MGGKQGNKNEQKQPPASPSKKIFYISYSSLYLQQSHDSPEFTPCVTHTLNSLLSSATHVAFSSFCAFEHITLLVLPGTSYIGPPSNSLLIFALLTQGSLFFLPLRRIHPLLPLDSHAWKVCFHYSFNFFFPTSYSPELSIGHICSYLLFFFFLRLLLNITYD